MLLRTLKISLLLSALLAAWQPLSARANEGSEREYALKAAFICKFVQFVEWPADAFSSPDEPLVIGVIGEDPFNGALAAAAAEARAGDRRIIVRHFASPEDIDICQLLFIPAGENPRLSGIFAKVQSRPILTVGETDEFPWAGGTIRFFIEDGKTHFEINVNSAQKARVQISSKLLKLARIFHR